MSTHKTATIKKRDESQFLLLKNAFNLAKTPILISLFVTPIRFLFEFYGFPENVIFIIGLLWLTLGFSIYWGIKLSNKANSYTLLFLSLIIFSPISRIPVSIAWWVDTKWELGTHYGLYFDTWPQVFLNHVFYGSLVQIIPGFILGSITLVILKNRKTILNE